jgi:hypothetical protein
MKKFFSLLLAVLGMAFALSMAADPAQAQATRTWVSGVGDDANPCSRTAPCKTFAGAISKTAVNGEINCLDPGGFGAVTITKSISLDCHEVFGSILVAGTNAINVPFDSFSDPLKTVNIRNLNFQGVASGLVAINVTGTGTGTTVNIEDCLMTGFTSGIVDTRAGGNLQVSNTTIRNMGTNGISLSASSLIKAALNNVRIVNTNNGMVLGNNTAAVISHTLISNNATLGVTVAPSSQANIDSSVIAHNILGLQSTGGTMRISNSDISFNNTGASGTIMSYTNNRFGQNGAGGTITAIGTTSNPTGQQ